MRDRRDGKRVKNINGALGLIPHLKPNRSNSDVYMYQKIDVSNLVKYMEKKKKINKELTYFHVFLTAIAKTINNRPLLNRYVVNRKFYDHNELRIGFVAKKSLKDGSEETMNIITIDHKDNLFSISNKTNELVHGVREKQESNDTNDFIGNISTLPLFLPSMIMGLIKFADRHDLIPWSLIKDDIYHSTMIISNLGSIKCNAIYHNLTDFGTSSSLLTVGTIRKEPVCDDKGNVIVKDIMDIGINLDERIADGFYFAKALKIFEHILANPDLLEENVDKKIEID